MLSEVGREHDVTQVADLPDAHRCDQRPMCQSHGASPFPPPPLMPLGTLRLDASWAIIRTGRLITNFLDDPRLDRLCPRRQGQRDQSCKAWRACVSR